MNVQSLKPDVLMFVGQHLQSVATAFIDGEDVVLVDSLASAQDAGELRNVLCEQMGKRVRMLVCTHFMSDHIAGLSQFPDALVLAHRHYRHTFLSQNHREDAFYREPSLVFDNLALRWGAHELRLLYNPGKTMDHLSVDVPSADLVCVGDNIVGNIVYLSKADPALLAAAIGRIRQLGRGTVVDGHMGCFSAAALDNALHYLRQLREAVVRIRLHTPALEHERGIQAIRIQDCVAPGVEPSDFEREWHGQNLDVIVKQDVFALDAALAARGRAA